MGSHATCPWSPLWCTSCSTPCPSNHHPCSAQTYRSQPSRQESAPYGNGFTRLSTCRPPVTQKLTLLACQPGTIVAVCQRFGGIAAVPGGGEQAVVWRWDMPPVDTPILDPHTALTCGWGCMSVAAGRCENVHRHTRHIVLQSGSPPGSLLQKVLQIRIPGQDARSGRCCRSGSLIKMSSQDGVGD